MNPIPLYFKSYEAPRIGDYQAFWGIAMNLVEGDTEIMPGVRVFETPGHSVGHQSVEDRYGRRKVYLFAATRFYYG